MEERVIRVHLVEHRKTGLLAAVSDDLRGLVVHGRTPQEIEKLLPDAIRDILVAQGFEVISVTAEPDERLNSAGFGPPAFIANASLAAAVR